MKNYEKYWVHAVVAIVALIVGFIIGAYWKGWDIRQARLLPELATSTDSTMSEIDGSSLVAGKTYSIYVPHQTAGSKIVVESISVRNPSWVVITEDDNGSPARILGAQQFVPGMITGSVDLLRATVPNATYHALIYNDNGDNVFDYKVDGPITDNDGKTIESIFTVS